HALGDTYPLLGHVWMAALHVISFGAIALRRSYAWGQLAMWLLAAASVGLLAGVITRELAGPGDARAPDERARPPARDMAIWSGCIAAALWLLDAGSSREGGWHYLMFHGVWPQLLSTALWTASLPLGWWAARRPSPRRVALTALTIGGALLAHPFGLLTVVTSGALGALTLALTARARPRGALVAWLIAHVLGVLLALAWLVTFLGGGEDMGRSPVPWEPWDALATALVTGELFNHQRAWIGPLALIGGALVVLVPAARRRPAPTAWLTLLCLIALLAQGSRDAITGLELDLVVPALKNLQFIRYAIAVKPLWYALAGVGAALLVHGLRRLPQLVGPREPGPGLTAAQRALLCAFLGPLALGVLDGGARLVARPVGAVDTLERTRHREHADALAEALAREQQPQQQQDPSRLTVAFLRRGMGGGTYPLFVLADLGARVVMDGHIPSVNTARPIQHRRPALLRGLGVTHVIHDKPRELQKFEPELSDALEPIGRFGPYTLARLRPAPAGEAGPSLPGLALWPDDQVQVRALDGPARRRGAQRYELELQGIRGDALPLDLLIAPHHKWRARFFSADGGEPRELELKPRALLEGGVYGARARVPGDGRTLFPFDATPRERAALGVSLAALALCLLALAIGRPPPGTRDDAAATPVNPRRARVTQLVIQLVALASALALALALARRQSRVLERTWQGQLAPDERQAARLVRDLSRAGRYRVTREPADICDALTSRDSRRGCSEADQRARVGQLYGDPYLYRCVELSVPAGGRAEVEFYGVDDSHEVRGLLAKDTGDGDNGKQLTWAIRDGERGPLALGTRAHRFTTAPRGGRVAVSLENRGDRDLTVCVAAAELARPG
ncbi:MAG: hypothetical protein KC468_25875, partial [Myxococcales bacterium]|nr:hypothetical protein [Myxococcales bacterium]